MKTKLMMIVAAVFLIGCNTKTRIIGDLTVMKVESVNNECVKHATRSMGRYPVQICVENFTGYKYLLSDEYGNEFYVYHKENDLPLGAKVNVSIKTSTPQNP